MLGTSGEEDVEILTASGVRDVGVVRVGRGDHLGHGREAAHSESEEREKPNVSFVLYLFLRKQLS